MASTTSTHRAKARGEKSDAYSFVFLTSSCRHANRVCTAPRCRGPITPPLPAANPLAEAWPRPVSSSPHSMSWPSTPGRARHEHTATAAHGNHRSFAVRRRALTIRGRPRCVARPPHCASPCPHRSPRVRAPRHAAPSVRHACSLRGSQSGLVVSDI